MPTVEVPSEVEEIPPPPFETELDGELGAEAVDAVAETVEERPPRPAAPEKKPQKPQQRKAGSFGATDPFRKAEREEAQDYLAEFRDLSGGAPIRVEVVRRDPETVRFKGKTVNVSGTLKTYDEIPDAETLKRNHGGGTFMLRLKMENTEGKYVFKKGRTVKVAGEPLVEDSFLNEEPQSQQQGGMDEAQRLLLNTTIDDKKRLEQKLDALGSKSGIDHALIDLLVGPLRETIKQQAADMTALRASLEKAREVPPRPEDAYKDKLLDRMMDTENARILAIKTNHESEVAQMKTAHRAEVERLEARFDRTLDDLKKQHERELSNTKALNDLSLGTINNSSNLQVKTLEAEIARLRSDLGKLDKENAELRAKKDKSMLEQLKEIGELKKALGIKDKDEDDEEEESTGSKVVAGIKALGIDKAVEAIGLRIAGAATPEPVRQLGDTWRNEQGVVLVMTEMGPRPMRQIPPGAVRRRAGAPRPPGQPAPAPGGAPAEGGATEVVPAEPPKPTFVVPQDKLQKAVLFLDACYRREDKPEQVAQNIRSLAPDAIPDILRAIREGGVDALLDQVAGLDGNSPLAQQAGRNYLRKIAKALLGQNE